MVTESNLGPISGLGEVVPFMIIQKMLCTAMFLLSKCSKAKSMFHDWLRFLLRGYHSLVDKGHHGFGFVDDNQFQ